MRRRLSWALSGFESDIINRSQYARSFLRVSPVLPFVTDEPSRARFPQNRRTPAVFPEDPPLFQAPGGFHPRPVTVVSCTEGGGLSYPPHFFQMSDCFFKTGAGDSLVL